MTARLGTLRERTGDGPLAPAHKPPFALRERIPGYDPPDLVVTSRDFR